MALRREAWAAYLRLFRGLTGRVLLSAAASVVLSLSVVPVALLLRRAFDRLIPARDVGGLIATGAAAVLLTLAGAGASLLVARGTLRLVKEVVQRLRHELLDRLFALSHAYTSRADLKLLHASLVHDSERVDEMTSALLTRVVPQLVLFAVLVAALAWLSVPLFVLAAALAPLVMAVVLLVGRRVRESYRLFQGSFAEYSAGTWSVLRALGLVRIQAAEGLELEKQGRRVEAVRDSGNRVAWLYAAHASAAGTAATVAGTIVLVAGAVAIVRGVLTLGSLVSFLVVLQMARGHLATVLAAFPVLTAGDAALAELHRLLALDEPHPYQGREPIGARGEISLQDVSFGHGGTPLLRRVDLVLEPGRCVALVGPNGCGKSTLVDLVLGLYRPWSGLLRADGVPYDRLDLSALRRTMGVVTQDPVFFHGTVLENVTYGRPAATSEELEEAARLALADEVLRDLPDGWQTKVGEEGALLSGGQRQRLAIARALLGKPRVLVLDEPTNHLDQPAIRRLMANLRSLSRHTSVLLVSHEPVVLGEADCAYVIRDGTVVEASRSPESERPGRELPDRAAGDA